MTREKRKLIELSFKVLQDLIPDEERYDEEDEDGSDHLIAFRFFEKLLKKESKRG